MNASAPCNEQGGKQEATKEKATQLKVCVCAWTTITVARISWQAIVSVSLIWGKKFYALFIIVCFMLSGFLLQCLCRHRRRRSCHQCFFYYDFYFGLYFCRVQTYSDAIWSFARNTCVAATHSYSKYLKCNAFKCRTQTQKHFGYVTIIMRKWTISLW